MISVGTSNFDELAVIGAGRMGHGIALTYARHGHRVRVHDVDTDVLASCEDRIRGALETLAANGQCADADIGPTLDRLSYHGSLAEAVGDADFVTEAVAEDLAVKQHVFEALDAHTPEGTVLATNTSGLSIDEITAPVADRERVLGTHWFNPPYIVPLVEIVHGSDTAAEIVADVRELIAAVGQTPVVVREDIPGFIGNRIQMAMAYEALSLLDRGVASAADIDRAVKAGFGFRLPLMGIFEKIDQSGIGIHHEVERSLMPALDRGAQPSEPLANLVEAGHDGLETGRGIYDWRDEDGEAVEAGRDEALLALQELFDRNVTDPPPQHYAPGADMEGGE